MEYESDILKRLINKYGVVGNPRYISEIIKEFIVMGKERFPELFTYQADWLAHIDEFGLNPSYTVSYTGQSIYAPNTLEKPVKSAILKGQTIKNLVNEQGFGGSNTLYESRFFNTPINTGEKMTIFVVNPLVRTIRIGFQNANNGGWSHDVTYDVTTDKRIVCTVPHGKFSKYVGVVVPTAHNSTGYENSLVILKGDYSQLEISSYFEGIKDVENPSLTLTNDDGTKSNILTVNEDVTLRSNGSVYDELDLLTGKLTQRIDENGGVLSQEIVKTVELTILDQNGHNVKQLMSFNGGTHFNTTSLEGSLLPSVSVSVETDLEETLKVCSLEGNTM